MKRLTEESFFPSGPVFPAFFAVPPNALFVFPPFGAVFVNGDAVITFFFLDPFLLVVFVHVRNGVFGGRTELKGVGAAATGAAKAAATGAPIQSIE